MSIFSTRNKSENSVSNKDNIMYDLRPYQKQMVKDILKSFDQHDRVLQQLPTGGGKTIVLANVAKHFAQTDHSILVLAHREELIRQAHDKLTKILNTDVGIVKSGYKSQIHLPVQVASVQSMVRRLEQFDNFNLIVVDEAHHSCSNTYMKILEHYGTSKVLGCTATPSRLDGKGLNAVFEKLLVGVDIPFLIRNKYLSSFRAYAYSKQMSLNNVRTTGGDYNSKDIADANDAYKLSGDLIKSYIKHGKNGKCIVFAVNIDHSKQIVERYNKAGFKAAHLDGKTCHAERQHVLEQFKNGEIQILSNVGLFDEGFDVPSASVVQIAKPTKSLVLHLQMLGRVLRRDGNKIAIIIDHTSNIERLGLPTRKHEWTLDGINKESRIQYETIKRENGELVEKKVITEEDIKLQRIRELKNNSYAESIDELYDTTIKKDYKKGWMYFRLLDLQPDLNGWLYAAHKLDYKAKWAEHKYYEQLEQLELEVA